MPLRLTARGVSAVAFRAVYGIITLCRRLNAAETHTAFENQGFSHKNIERLKFLSPLPIKSGIRRSETNGFGFYGIMFAGVSAEH